MAFRSWPHDYEPDGTTEQETFESDFRFSLSAATQDGIDPGAGDALEAMVSGPEVVLAPGRGVVDGYGFASSAPEPVAIPVNTSSLPRLYRVVARLDVAAHQVVPHVIEGTAASSPSAPALTRTDTIYDLPLWRCRRAGGGGTITELVDERVYLNPSGAVVCTSTSRPPAPRPGTIIYETDTGHLLYWHSGQWVTASDGGAYPTAWQPIPLRSGYEYAGNGATPSWRWVRPGTVEVRGTIGRVVDAGIPNDTYIGTMPAAARPNANRRYVGATARSSAGISARLEIRSTFGGTGNPGRIWVWNHGTHTPAWVSLDGWTYDVS